MQFLKLIFLFGVLLQITTGSFLLALESSSEPQLLDDCDLYAVRSLRWQTPWTMTSNLELPLHFESIEIYKLIEKTLKSQVLADKPLDATSILDLTDLMTFNLQDFPAFEFANTAKYRLESEDSDGYYSVEAKVEIVDFLHSHKLNALWKHIDVNHGDQLRKRWWDMLEKNGPHYGPLRGQLFLLQHTETATPYLRVISRMLQLRGLKMSHFERLFTTGLEKRDMLGPEVVGMPHPHFKCQSFSLKKSSDDKEAVQDILLGHSADPKNQAIVNIWYHSDFRGAGDGCSNEISYLKTDDGSFCSGDTTNLGFLSLSYSLESQDYKILKQRRQEVPSVFSSTFEAIASFDSFKIITSGNELTYKFSNNMTDLEVSKGTNDGDLKSIFSFNSKEKTDTHITPNFSNQYYENYKISPADKFLRASTKTYKGDYAVTLYDKIPSQVEPDQGSHIVYPLPDNRGFIVLQNSNLTLLSIQQ